MLRSRPRIVLESSWSGGTFVAVQTNSWINDRIQYIDYQIDSYKKKHHNDQIGKDNWPVENVDRINNKLTHAGPGKNSFSHY